MLHVLIITCEYLLNGSLGKLTVPMRRATQIILMTGDKLKDRPLTAVRVALMSTDLSLSLLEAFLGCKNYI
jgi:hypothetical protein